ncbi:hypothetical protein [Microvirga massiliensis]|uniref:hypothetical protein n=1 Tax=Microvirga massiliensis TaxID=1033741 RepID=UPI000B02192A|nr:hypothetical protein [Microvirga massiliensis]
MIGRIELSYRRGQWLPSGGSRSLSVHPRLVVVASHNAAERFDQTNNIGEPVAFDLSTDNISRLVSERRLGDVRAVVEEPNVDTVGKFPAFGAAFVSLFAVVTSDVAADPAKQFGPNFYTPNMQPPSWFGGGRVEEPNLAPAKPFGVVENGGRPNWIEVYVQANGGCGLHRHTLDPTFWRWDKQKSAAPLGKPAEEWTDEDIATAGNAYRDCERELTEAVAQRGVRPGPNEAEVTDQLARRIERDLAQIVSQARRQLAQRAVQEQAQIALAEANAQRAVEQAQRDRRVAEETARRAELEQNRLSEAQKEADQARLARQLAEERLVSARRAREIEEQTRRDREAAVAMARQAESEERRLAELKAENERAQQEKKAAEEKLAEIRRATEAEDQRRKLELAETARLQAEQNATTPTPQP